MRTLYWVRISMMLAVGFMMSVFSLLPEGPLHLGQVITDFAPTIMIVAASIACVVIGALALLKRARSNVDDEINEMYDQYEQRNSSEPAPILNPPEDVHHGQATGGFGKRV